MKIGIVGLGFVGLSFASVLASKGFNVVGIDNDKKKVQTISLGRVPFFEPGLNIVLKKALKNGLKLSTKIEDSVKKCQFIFVTVGTPLDKNGNINLKMVLDVCKKIGLILSKTKNKPIIVIKSTVIPGTTTNEIKKTLEQKSQKKAWKDFGLLTNPEFLREGRAIKDTVEPHLIVIGGTNKKEILKLKKFYKKFYKKFIPIIITNNTTAEVIKYANNSFLATKISFINSMANLCQKLPGTNIDDVANAIGIDPRIGKQFLNAGPGYGGSCLPKDIQAMIRVFTKIGEKPLLLNAVQETNSLQVTKIVKLVETELGNLKNKQITILGLSFKEESDDIRESVSIKLIKILLKKQAKIQVHDPKAIKNTQKIFGEKVKYYSKINDSLKKSHCAIIMTPWKQYTKLKNSDLQKMSKKIVIDTRRILSLKEKDLKYIGLGIG